MIQQAFSLYSIFKKAQSISVTLRNNTIIGIRLHKMQPHIFPLLNNTGFVLTDITASNHPERFFCNTIYYIYGGLTSHVYLSALTTNHGSIPTASLVNFSALVTERECYEMFGIIFENHPDLRKLLLDYGAIGNPLLKSFPLTGYNQISYTVNKGLLFKEISLPQSLRVFTYMQPWILNNNNNNKNDINF